MPIMEVSCNPLGELGNVIYHFQRNVGWITICAKADIGDREEVIPLACPHLKVFIGAALICSPDSTERIVRDITTLLGSKLASIALVVCIWAFPRFGRMHTSIHNPYLDRLACLSVATIPCGDYHNIVGFMYNIHLVSCFPTWLYVRLPLPVIVNEKRSV